MDKALSDRLKSRDPKIRRDAFPLLAKSKEPADIRKLYSIAEGSIRSWFSHYDALDQLAAMEALLLGGTRGADEYVSESLSFRTSRTTGGPPIDTGGGINAYSEGAFTYLRDISNARGALADTLNNHMVERKLDEYETVLEYLADGCEICSKRAYLLGMCKIG